MGEAHEMYGKQDDNGEFNPFDGEPDDDPVAAAGLLCSNCDGPIRGRKYPYLFCSELCSEEAHTIRYARGVTRDGRINDPKVREAVQIRVGLLLGGGYLKSERELSPEARAFIFERDGSLCQVCGQPGDQIDHINQDLELAARNINDPKNLRVICDDCHRAKTLSGFRPLEAEHLGKAKEIRARINAAMPLRECDDETVWSTLWRQRGSERSALVKRARADSSN